MGKYWYTGNTVCQGCGKTGKESARESKDKLCTECHNLLKNGFSNRHEEKIRYQSIRDWYNGYGGFDFDDRSLEDFATNILGKLHNRYIQVSYGDITNTKRGRNIHGSVHYNLPIGISRLIVKLLDTLDSHYRKLRDMREDSEQYMNECRKNAIEIARIEVEKERDRIYNEGVEKGRSLLFQLNRGEINANDLNNNYSYKNNHNVP